MLDRKPYLTFANFVLAAEMIRIASSFRLVGRRTTNEAARMNTTAKALPQKISLASIVALLPLALSQAYVIWLVATGILNYMQVLLITAAELWLVLFISTIFFSPTLQVLGKRIAQLFFNTLALVFMLVFSSIAAVSHDLHPGTREQPLFRMIDVFKAILTADVFRDGLIYLAVTLGLSLVMASVTRPARRYWFNNVIQPYSATLIAMVVTTFAAFFLADPKGPTVTSAVEIVCILSGMRVLCTWVFANNLFTPAQKELEFQKFTAAEV
jgi:hypothetical protein